MRAAPADEPDWPAGFVAFWKSNHRAFVGEAMFIYLLSREDAQDMVDAVFEKLLRMDNRDWLTGNPRAYFRTALKNTYIDRYRREQKWVREMTGLAIRESHVDQGLNTWEDWEWVAELLGKLPAAQRACMERRIQDYTPAEIAEQLGKSPETVRQNLLHGRNQLKEELLDSGKEAS